MINIFNHNLLIICILNHKITNFSFDQAKFIPFIKGSSTFKNDPLNNPYVIHGVEPAYPVESFYINVTTPPHPHPYPTTIAGLLDDANIDDCSEHKLLQIPSRSHIPSNIFIFYKLTNQIIKLTTRTI